MKVGMAKETQPKLFFHQTRVLVRKEKEETSQNIHLKKEILNCFVSFFCSFHLCETPLNTMAAFGSQFLSHKKIDNIYVC